MRKMLGHILSIVFHDLEAPLAVIKRVQGLKQQNRKECNESFEREGVPGNMATMCCLHWVLGLSSQCCKSLYQKSTN